VRKYLNIFNISEQCSNSIFPSNCMQYSTATRCETVQDTATIIYSTIVKGVEAFNIDQMSVYPFGLTKKKIGRPQHTAK